LTVTGVIKVFKFEAVPKLQFWNSLIYVSLDDVTRGKKVSQKQDRPDQA
jgi:hypothetical protein